MNRRVVLILFPLLAPAGALAADLDEEIGDATDLGIEFLLKAIEAKQFERGEPETYRTGKIALETYALVVAGVSVEHPLIRRNFETLASMNLDHTYSVACYSFALDAAINQLQTDAALQSPSQKLREDPGIGGAYRLRLEAAVNALVRMRRAKGGWHYTGGSSGFDNSNTQFAVLGLGVGAKRRVPIPREVWEEVSLHFTGGQKKEGPEVMERPEYYAEEDKGEGKRDRIVLLDQKTGEKVEKSKKTGQKTGEESKEKGGSPTAARPAPPEKKAELGIEANRWFARGWDYSNSGGESWNMTCGGLSSMIVAEENLRGQVPPDFQAKISKSIQDGYAWLMRNWNISGGGGEWKYYGLYSLEKVADLGEVKRFGAHDWYVEVAQLILNEQRGDGSWPGGNPLSVRWNSAFALLVLNRATSLLTQGRSVGKGGKIVLTGAIRRDKAISPDRNWVFVPEYEREFHIPSLLRQIKLRPTPKLLRIVELAIKHYPEEGRGVLVPHLARARDFVKHKQVRSFLETELLNITGFKYETTADYEDWTRRWVEVQKIGTQAGDPDRLLEKYYAKTSKSLPLRKKIIWAIARCKDQSLAPALLEDLNHVEPDIRHAAYEALSFLRLSREPIPVFEARGEPAARDQQVTAIREWYQKRQPAS